MESQHDDPLSALLCPAVALLALLLAVAPTAADTATITSCEDASLFSAGRTPDDAAFDFSKWDLEVFAGARVAGSSLRWHVQPSSPDQDHARLVFARPLDEALDELSLWIKNPNGHKSTLALELTDADAVTYRSREIDLAEEQNWRQITFKLGDLEATADDPCPPLSFPITRLSIVLRVLEAGRPHTIYLDEIEGTVDERADLHIEDMRVQTALGPGEPVSLRARISPAEAAARATLVARMTTSEGGLIDSAVARVAEDGELRASLRVPNWLRPDRYAIGLTSDYARLVGPGANPVQVVVGGSHQPPPPVALATGGNEAGLTIGEETGPAVVHELRGAPASALRDDSRVIGIPATTDTHPFGWAADVLSGDGEADYSMLDRRISAALQRVPDGLIVLQVFLDSPPAWDAGHPEDLQQFDGQSVGPPDLFRGRRTCPDILSPRWQHDALRRLRELVAYVKRAPWGDRVVGYELQAGDLGAWRPWGVSAGIGDDATHLRQRLFRTWLRERYDDVSGLRDAWLGRRRGFGKPSAGFEAVEIPVPLPDAPEPSLYDPAIDQPMIDLQHFRAEAPAELLLDAARAVREEAGPDALIGASYGHLLSQVRAMDWTWPHLAISRCLDSGDLDFLTGPLYRRNDPAPASFPARSALREGIVYFERTPTAGAPAAGHIIPADQAVDGPAESASDDNAPAVIEVIDDVSARYLSGDGDLPRDLLTRPMSGGLPHQVHLLRDLIGSDAPKAPIYVFRDLFSISAADGRRLARNICRDGALLIWVYAPGAVSRNLITGRTMEYLTGLKLAPLPRRGVLRVKPDDRALSPFGFSGEVSPWFISADDEAEWLGSLAGTESDFCGLALRDFGDCTSAFCAAPPSEEVIRHLARIADTELPNTEVAPHY